MNPNHESVPRDTYTLLDSGAGERLEQIGPYRIARPAPSACYRRTMPELWNHIDARYHRSDKGGGEWEHEKRLPEQFPIALGDLQAKVRLTGFGHIGLFPEQRANWDLIRSFEFPAPQEINVLNLFAYSGMSTVACLRQGFSVCHVDSSRGMADWAGDNVKLNGVAEAPVRWIVDDAVKFVRREVKRGRRYQGFILDPPAYGRGLKGEVWKLENDIGPLLESLMELCSGQPLFMIFSCYSHGFGPSNLERLLRTYIPGPGLYSARELLLPEYSGRFFAAGACACYLGQDLRTAPPVSGKQDLPQS